MNMNHNPYVELAALLVVVTDLEVAKNAGFVEVAELDHVLDALGRRWVHNLQLGVRLCRGNPLFLHRKERADLRWRMKKRTNAVLFCFLLLHIGDLHRHRQW